MQAILPVKIWRQLNIMQLSYHTSFAQRQAKFMYSILVRRFKQVVQCVQFASALNIQIQINMQAGQKGEKRLVRKTIIPIKIEDNPKQLRGIVRFSTESFKTQINPVTCHTERKKSTVIYKNQNAKNEEEEEEEKRKKEIELYEVTLSPARFKNKQFKVEIPIARGPKSIKASKANDLYYTFTFSNSEGRITLLNGQYEAKMEFVGTDRKEISYNQRLEMQLSKLDNRKKETLGELKPHKSDSD